MERGDTSSLEICAVLVVIRVNTTPEELISVGFWGCAKPWRRGGVLIEKALWRVSFSLNSQMRAHVPREM